MLLSHERFSDLDTQPVSILSLPQRISHQTCSSKLLKLAWLTSQTTRWFLKYIQTPHPSFRSLDRIEIPINVYYRPSTFTIDLQFHYVSVTNAISGLSWYILASNTPILFFREVAFVYQHLKMFIIGGRLQMPSIQTTRGLTSLLSVSTYSQFAKPVLQGLVVPFFLTLGCQLWIWIDKFYVFCLSRLYIMSLLCLYRYWMLFQCVCYRLIASDLLLYELIFAASIAFTTLFSISVLPFPFAAMLLHGCLLISTPSDFAIIFFTLVSILISKVLRFYIITDQYFAPPPPRL